MKLHLAIALLLTIGLAPLASASDVTVHLSLTAGSHLAPAYHACDVVVPAGSNGKDVLDAAAAQGCIDSVDYGFGGAFVECIDDLCGQNVANTFGTFWGFYVDEAFPCGGTCGILDVTFNGGESVEFAYVDWYTPFFVPL